MSDRSLDTPHDGGRSPQISRLALRVEGDNWNAYYAKEETMDGAIFLGSIRMLFVVNSAERKQEFMDLMRNVLADVIEEETGVRPEWGGAVRAPEHERSGHG